MSTDANPYTAPNPASPQVVATPASARSQLFPVALWLLVVSILHITGGLFFFVYTYSVSTEPGTDPAIVHNSFVYCLYSGISMLYCLVLATGAVSMLRQGSYLWAMTVCVLALVPFFGACYFFAMPAGLWGIIVLRRPAVRAAFSKA